MSDAETRHTEAMLAHLRAAAEADTEAERDLLLKAAVLRMAPNYLYALYGALMEFADPCLAMKRRKPEKTARLLGAVSGGRLYAVEPECPVNKWSYTSQLLVAEHDGHVVVTVAGTDGNPDAYLGAIARFPMGTADDAALRGIGYEVVGAPKEDDLASIGSTAALPTASSPELAKPAGIPGIPEFVAERERREANEASTATWMRNMDQFGNIALYRLNPPLMGFEWVLAVRIKGAGAEGRFIVTESSPAGDVRNCLRVKDGTLSHEDGWRKCGYALVGPE